MTDYLTLVHMRISEGLPMNVLYAPRNRRKAYLLYLYNHQLALGRQMVVRLRDKGMSKNFLTPADLA